MQTMKPFVFIFHLILCCLIITTTTAQNEARERNGDTKITRVRNLREEEKNFAGPTEKTRSIYLVNILPIPLNRRNNEENTDKPVEDSNELRQRSFQSDPRGRVPALFFLQKVNDEENLPDGIYYRPADDSEPPQPVVQKDISRLHAFALASRPRISTGGSP